MKGAHPARMAAGTGVIDAAHAMACLFGEAYARMRRDCWKRLPADGSALLKWADSCEHGWETHERAALVKVAACHAAACALVDAAQQWRDAGSDDALGSAEQLCRVRAQELLETWAAALLAVHALFALDCEDVRTECATVQGVLVWTLRVVGHRAFKMWGGD